MENTPEIEILCSAATAAPGLLPARGRLGPAGGPIGVL